MKKYYVFYGDTTIDPTNASKEFDEEQEATEYIEGWHKEEPDVLMELWEYGYKGRRKQIKSY